MDETQADLVYQLVAQGFADLGASGPRCINRSSILTTMLYVGQAFRCEGFQAVWLIDSNSVEFPDAAGTPVETVTLAVEPLRKAA